MTVQEVIRLRETIRDELDGGADQGAPRTRLIRSETDGFLLAIRWLGRERILAGLEDLEVLQRSVAWA